MIQEGCSLQFSERNEYRNYFVERFEIGEKIMERYTFWVRGKRVWAFSGRKINADNVEIIGIKALTLGSVPKPSTAFLRIVGQFAKKNVVELEHESALKFLWGEDIEMEFPVEYGYVIVKHGNDVLGCGLYKGKLINQIPKKYRFVDTWI